MLTDDKGQLESKYNNRIIIAWNKINTLIRWIKDPRCKADLDVVKYRLSIGWSPEKSLETIQYLG